MRAARPAIGFIRPVGPADIEGMIYLVYEQQELIAETDNLEYLKKVVRTHPDCSIRELGSKRVYRPKLVPKSA